MKKFSIIILLAIFTIACNDSSKEEQEVRYSQDSEQINTLKAVLQDYEKSDWNAMRKHYADTAQIFHNSKEGMNIGESVNRHKETLSGLSSYEFIDEEDDYEMVVTDEGHTWVNFWGDWKGTIVESNQQVIIPVHLTARFEDGKIVREYAYYDNSIMMLATMENDSLNAQQDSTPTN